MCQAHLLMEVLRSFRTLVMHWFKTNPPCAIGSFGLCFILSGFCHLWPGNKESPDSCPHFHQDIRHICFFLSEMRSQTICVIIIFVPFCILCVTTCCFVCSRSQASRLPSTSHSFRRFPFHFPLSYLDQKYKQR